jgi:hypothetical protein
MKKIIIIPLLFLIINYAFAQSNGDIVPHPSTGKQVDNKIMGMDEVDFWILLSIMTIILIIVAIFLIKSYIDNRKKMNSLDMNYSPIN